MGLACASINALRRHLGAIGSNTTSSTGECNFMAGSCGGFVEIFLMPNRSVETDTQLHGAASRAGERTPRGAMQLRAAHLRRYTSPKALESGAE